MTYSGGHMACKIITRQLGKISEQPDHTFLVRIRGEDNRTFPSKAEAQKYFDRKAPKRYDVMVWNGRKLEQKTFDNKKAAEAFRDRSNISIRDGQWKEIPKAKLKTTFQEYATIYREKYLILSQNPDDDGLKESSFAGRQYAIDMLSRRFGTLRQSSIVGGDFHFLGRDVESR
jgi:hypothetical protein